MIHKIHLTQIEQEAQKQTHSFEAILAILKEISNKTDKEVTIKDSTDHIRKLEEIKSALLIANKLLKDLKQKEFPEMPKTDLTETNKLLIQLIEKEELVTVTLTLI